MKIFINILIPWMKRIIKIYKHLAGRKRRMKNLLRNNFSIRQFLKKPSSTRGMPEKKKLGSLKRNRHNT